MGAGFASKKCNRWCRRQSRESTRIRELKARMKMQEDGGWPQRVPGLLRDGVGAKECQLDKGSWEGSQDTRESGVTGLWWTMVSD